MENKLNISKLFLLVLIFSCKLILPMAPLKQIEAKLVGAVRETVKNINLAKDKILRQLPIILQNIYGQLPKSIEKEMDDVFNGSSVRLRLYESTIECKIDDDMLERIVDRLLARKDDIERSEKINWAMMIHSLLSKVITLLRCLLV